MTSDRGTYPGYCFPTEIISHAVWLYHVFGLSLRDVELVLAALRSPTKASGTGAADSVASSQPSCGVGGRAGTSVPPQQGRGGEMAIESQKNRRERPWIVDTVKDRPGMLAADASVARLAGAAARMMETYQRGLLTLERLRNGGKQTVVVQHVDVANGGQAVVAGTMNQGENRK
jgi:hypothetical protein